MASYTQLLIVGIGGVVQFTCLFVGIGLVLKLLFAPQNRWRIHLRDLHQRQVPQWWLTLWRTDKESISLQERRVLLAGCGIRWSPEIYLAYRRCLLALTFSLGLLVYLLERQKLLTSLLSWNLWFILFFLNLILLFDRIVLQSFRKFRTDRIRLEIVVVSSQLLYYTGSKLHLHGKLMKCLPLTRQIRSEMSLLLNEWYHNADAALKRFKERLGTEEAYGFAESLRSLRLNESDAMYSLLREVIQDYKSQMEISKDSRKETASYLLFVLAGIPILYTFQIFLYPWVQEATKLFDSLNP